MAFPPPLSDKEPQINDYEMPSSRVCGGGIPDDNVLDTLSEDGKYTHLLCRTIRIGSLKVFPKERVFISSHGIKLIIPMKENMVQVKIYRHEIVKVLAHFGKGMPVIFYYIRAHVGPRIRELLGMNKQTKFYFDPSSRDETHRRITLLPEKIPDEVKSILSVIYSKEATISPNSDEALLDTGPCLEELSIKEANNILVKSSPPELRNLNSSTQPTVPTPIPPPVQTIFIYRPTGISINTEDYACLDREQFINDVIIDFYLGFLLQEMATPQIKANTHIFSTFFYKRLTQKPTRKVQGSIENDPSVSAAKKRHSRVQSWTKNINVFEKDYIVVPINSNAHWFLAIICFPGLRGCENLEGRAVEECQRFKSVRKREKMKLDEMQKTGKSNTVTIGNTTISPVIKAGTSTPTPGTPSKDPAAPGASVPVDEEEENRDEAESEGEDFADASQVPGASQGDTQRAQSPLRDFEGPVRHPCILIFDSLPQAGNSRVRVVATLRDWLAQEYEVKHNGHTRDFSKNVFIGAKPKVPMQTNYYDCGLYLLHYAERFFLDPLTDYRLPILLENWFTAYDTHRKRYDLQHLLFVLMERQGIDRNSLNLPQLNLNDPDYKSPEHEPEPPDMLEAKYHAASHDGRDDDEDGREEAEGDEEMMGDEEEEEEEDALCNVDNGASSRRREEESANCDNMNESSELDTTGDHDGTEEESLVQEEDYVEEEEEEEPSPPKLIRGTPKTSAPLTKQITITPMGVTLRQISVTASQPSTSVNTPVRAVHIPRPKSKQLLAAAAAASNSNTSLQLVIPPPGTKSPLSYSQGPGTRNPGILQNRSNVTIKRKLSSPAPSPASTKKQATPLTVTNNKTVSPPAVVSSVKKSTSSVPATISSSVTLTTVTSSKPVVKPVPSPPGNVGSSNLRNMRIVKKKADDGDEEEEAGES